LETHSHSQVQSLPVGGESTPRDTADVPLDRCTKLHPMLLLRSSRPVPKACSCRSLWRAPPTSQFGMEATPPGSVEIYGEPGKVDPLGPAL